jgi:hypothetical protein
MSFNPSTDGTGKNNAAKVDSENRLHTHAFTVTINQSAALGGDTYNVQTGVIELTNANESAIFHIENTGDDDILVFEQFLIVGTSSGGSGSPTITYSTNADSSSTIISSGTALTPSNRRLASSKVLSATTLKGGQGSTLVGGTQEEFLTNGFFNTSPFVIPKGVSMTIAIQPPTGNTSQEFTFGINLIQNASAYGND